VLGHRGFLSVEDAGLSLYPTLRCPIRHTLSLGRIGDGPGAPDTYLLNPGTPAKGSSDVEESIALIVCRTAFLRLGKIIAENLAP
jgi:hypothetical protein